MALSGHRGMSVYVGLHEDSVAKVGQWLVDLPSRATILRHAAVLEGSPERARAVLLSALRKIRYAMTGSSQGA
jgi:hypothetical protein